MSNILLQTIIGTAILSCYRPLSLALKLDYLRTGDILKLLYKLYSYKLIILIYEIDLDKALFQKDINLITLQVVSCDLLSTWMYGILLFSRSCFFYRYLTIG